MGMEWKKHKHKMAKTQAWNFIFPASFLSPVNTGVPKRIFGLYTKLSVIECYSCALQECYKDPLFFSKQVLLKVNSCHSCLSTMAQDKLRQESIIDRF